MVAASLEKNLGPSVPKLSIGRWLFCLQEYQELYTTCSLNAETDVGDLRAFVTNW